MKNSIELHWIQQKLFRHQTTCVNIDNRKFRVVTLTELHFDLKTLAKFRSFLNKNSCTTASKNSEFDSVGAIFNQNIKKITFESFNKSNEINSIACC